jgi:hypothetical protein
MSSCRSRGLELFRHPGFKTGRISESNHHGKNVIRVAGPRLQIQSNDDGFGSPEMPASSDGFDYGQVGWTRGQDVTGIEGAPIGWVKEDASLRQIFRAIRSQTGERARDPSNGRRLEWLDAVELQGFEVRTNWVGTCPASGNWARKLVPGLRCDLHSRFDVTLTAALTNWSRDSQRTCCPDAAPSWHGSESRGGESWGTSPSLRTWKRAAQQAGGTRRRQNITHIDNKSIGYPFASPQTRNLPLPPHRRLPILSPLAPHRRATGEIRTERRASLQPHNLCAVPPESASLGF